MKRSALQEYIDRRQISAETKREPVSQHLGMVVVIPCYDEPDLLQTLKSLYDAVRPACAVEVIVVVNAPEIASEAVLRQNATSIREIKLFAGHINSDTFKVIPMDVICRPLKYAGVGLARKTGMDEAVARFFSVGKEDGVIVSLDADCTVASDYFTELEKTLLLDRKASVATIHFLHTLPPEDSVSYEAMVQYELYLRYYKQALHYTGFPYAYYTIGSAFAVKASAYCRSGGMGKYQSGEDFYFLQKVFQQGGIRELNTTVVYPSSRLSDRVPFGTGPSLMGMVAENRPVCKYSYALESFLVLKSVFEKREAWYETGATMTEQESSDYLTTGLPVLLTAYLEKNGFVKSLMQLRANCAGVQVFSKRFFDWYNGLRILQSLNVLQETYPPRPVQEETRRLAQLLWKPDLLPDTTSGLLHYMREHY